jgi:hypothetical protein
MCREPVVSGRHRNAAANGDTVLVGDGTRTGSGQRKLNFGGREIVVRPANGPLECVLDCRELRQR